MQLNGLGANPVLFSDGSKLVEAYKACNGSGVKFILMDLGMPGMDGYAVYLNTLNIQATTEIRKFEAAKKLAPVKIHGLSGGSKYLVINRWRSQNCRCSKGRWHGQLTCETNEQS